MTEENTPATLPDHQMVYTIESEETQTETTQPFRSRAQTLEKERQLLEGKQEERDKDDKTSELVPRFLHIKAEDKQTRKRQDYGSIEEENEE